MDKDNKLKIVETLEAKKALEKYKNKGSKWSLTQDILQEIQATHKIAGIERSSRKLEEDLKIEICDRYKDDEELRDLLLKSVPAYKNILNWLKKPGWDDAVWDKIKTTGIFTQKTRIDLLKALIDRGIQKGDVQAIKLALTISGDYSENMQPPNSKEMDLFARYQDALRKPKNE